MLDEIQDITSYLKEYGKALTNNITQVAKPLFNPGDEWNSKIGYLLKKPYQAQGDVIMSVSRLLEEYKSAIVVGEMGTGKTLIGLSVPYLYKNGKSPARTLVMCPGHLVKKWQREILETIPNAQAKIVKNLNEVISFNKKSKPTTYEYIIISKDRAKLGYAWKPAVVSKRKRFYCPCCATEVKDKDNIPVSYNYLKRSKRYCTNCNSPLWQADNTKTRRFPLSEYIKKYLKGYFDFYIADEVHELKSGSTAQGNSFGALSSACGKTIALTGTFLGGYADDIFYILYRLSPETMKEEGFNYNRVSEWIAKYGVLERITKSYPEDNIRSRGKKPYTRIKKKPGISPLVFAKHLLDKCVFLNLEDIALNLPPITEQAIRVEMDKELGEAYGELADDLLLTIKEALNKGSKALLGTYLNTLLSYPDRPFDNKPIAYPDRDELITIPKELPKDKTYPKEYKLIELIKEELPKDRNVFVYCQYTNTKDITSRLQERLMEEDIPTEILRSSIKPEEREDWIKNKVISGTKVIIGNPKLVETGLDLYSFPTMIFYQTGYSVFTLRQASRRSWRIGQDKEVKIYYLFYGSTMQEKALQLMGSKLEASLAIEGKFSEEGLLAMTAGEDMTIALAKALVEGLDTEGVEEIWSNLNQSNNPDYKQQESVEGKLRLVFGMPLPYKKRRRKPKVDPRQMCLEFE
jgi:SNF2 family DNA or RNA helicase